MTPTQPTDGADGAHPLLAGGAALPGLPPDPGGPTFAEPWQAEAFALTVALADAGAFSPSEWTDALAAAIAEGRRAGDPDQGDTYYEHWLRALEQLCARKGLLQPVAVDARTEAWREAYRDTPHGHPVELRTATPGAPGGYAPAPPWPPA